MNQTLSSHLYNTVQYELLQGYDKMVPCKEPFRGCGGRKTFQGDKLMLLVTLHAAFCIRTNLRLRQQSYNVSHMAVHYALAPCTLPIAAAVGEGDFGQ